MHPLMYDRGRGPELRSCRITVYDLIPYLLAPNYCDERVLEAWQIVTPEELAALKQHVTDHFEEVMIVHHKVEDRIRRGMEAQNTPDFLARAVENRKRMYAFRDFLAGWEAARGGQLPITDEGRAARLAAFNAWYEGLKDKVYAGDRL